MSTSGRGHAGCHHPITVFLTVLAAIVVGLVVPPGAHAQPPMTEAAESAAVQTPPSDPAAPVPAGAPAAIPAFPGAEGGGAAAVGGRGGRIIEVTNLDDSGPGSLRAAVESDGPRIVVFRVGGTITLDGGLDIASPFLTIAGQTAPGGGIVLRAAEGSTDALVNLHTHDVVIRFLRFRRGYTADPPESSREGGMNVAVWPGSHDVIFDHISASWTQDENFTVWASNADPLHHVTLSWSTVAEPLSNHPTNTVVGGEERAWVTAMTDIDLHHNLVMNSSYRNPLLDNERSRVVNNVIYNTSWYGTGLTGGIDVDVIGNSYLAGPNTDANMPTGRRPVSWRPRTDHPGSPPGDPSIHISGNVWSALGPGPAADQWSLVEGTDNDNWEPYGRPLTTSYRRAAPLASTAYAITSEPATTAAKLVLADAGASRRLDANGNWVAASDGVDRRLVKEVRGRRGIVPAIEDDVGGYPVVAAGTPYPDTDHDGMANAWETRYGLNPASPADLGGDPDGDGYTNVEEFLNGTVPMVNLIGNGDVAGFGEWQLAGGVTPATTGAGAPSCLTAAQGAQLWDEQLNQTGLALQQGRRYRVSLNARASSSGIVRLIVGTSAAPWTHDLLRDMAVGTTWKTFRYEFTMGRASDRNALLALHLGNATARDVCIDNVTVTQG